jgi:inner membrane transporter RhtA
VTDVRRSGATVPLLVVAVAFSLNTGAALATRVINLVGVIDAVWLRTAMAAAILVALRPRALRLPPAGYRLGVALLTCSLLLMNLSFYGAIVRLPLGIAVAIQFLGPLTVALAGSRRPLDLVWVGCAAASVVLLAGPAGSLDVVGVVLALVSAVCWGSYIVLAKRAISGLAPVQVMVLMLVGSAVLLAPVLLVRGARFVHSPTAVGLGAAVAMLSSALPYFLELVALRRVTAATYSVLLCIGPGVAALMGFVIAGQTLTPSQVLAVLGITAAVAGATWSGTRRGRPAEKSTMDPEQEGVS